MGATGFTGRLVAEYLAGRAAGLRVGLAGRSREKLELVRSEIGERAAGWEVCVVDSADGAGLRRLADRAAVIGSTVGPFMRYGLPLVEACAAAGTAYADITGEPHFVRESIGRAHAAAQASGARIVHCCGYDSIPSDLGTQFLADQAAQTGERLARAMLVTGPTRGGFSGGTLASMGALVAAARTDRGLRRLLADPYNLSPDREKEPDLGRQPDMGWTRHDPWIGQRVAPFLMAPINTRIVRRSNALLGWRYGRNLRYSEAMGLPKGPGGWIAGQAIAGGMAGLTAMMAWGPTRGLLERWIPPGAGPSAEARRRGFFKLKIHGETEGGRRLAVRVEGEGDPGYGATCRMLGEAMLELAETAQSGEGGEREGGVLTPAAAMGGRLRARLGGAGMVFAVV